MILPRYVCRTLLRVVENNGWSRPGDGNFHYYLEQYAFYKDRKFHNTDVYNARGKATLVPLLVRPSISALAMQACIFLHC